MSQAGDYGLTPSLEKEIHKISEDVQLRNYGHFLEQHDSLLETMSQNFDEGYLIKYDVMNDPLTIDFKPYESANIIDVISSDNKFLNKILEVFADLCAEVWFLQKEGNDKYYNKLMLYGEGSNITETEIPVYVGKMLELLQDLLIFIQRCRQVALQFLCQLVALCKTGQMQFNYTGHFQDVFNHLGDVLVIMITLDEILTSSTLLHHWALYQRTVKSVLHNHTKFQIDLDKLGELDTVLTELHSQLLSDKIFQNGLEQCSFVKSEQSEKYLKLLSEQFNFYLKCTLNELEKCDADNTDTIQATNWVKINAIFVLNVLLFGNNDKKFFRHLKEVNKKIPGVTLVGNVMWFPERFFTRHVSAITDNKLVHATVRARQTYLAQKSQNLLKDTHSYCLQTSLWIVQLHTVLQDSSTNFNQEYLKLRCNMLLQGVQYTCHISQLIKSMTNVHVCQGRPMTKTCLLAVCKLVEILKSLQQTFTMHFFNINHSTHSIMQNQLFQSLNTISVTKKYLLKDKSFIKKHPTVLSSLTMASRALNGPVTRERILVARLALALADPNKAFHEDHLSNLLKHLEQLDVMCNLQNRIINLCSCSFLYWHQTILPIYFSNLLETKTDFSKISCMFHALNDTLITDNGCSKMEIEETLEEKILQPLCHDIETNLRLHIHSHLQLDSSNPFSNSVNDCRTLISVRPIRLDDRYVDIKGYVEHYLDNMFYNLTTVVLHDWKTYKEMRRLAYEKYNLETVEDHLPTQTLEQGLDVLEIMRNINVFVSKYLYNLNNQIFVEQWSNNKHLNTINIRHVANSIRTHGTGIMNTTVNFTFQFLRKKFYVFSQFLFDEHIKSRLMKDLRFFQEHRTEQNPMYSYDRAELFNKAIRKLGLSSNGQSYLDKFRLLISHIGNAMGYVRMVRAGGLHCCSNASVFLPSLDDTFSLEEKCHNSKLSPLACDASHNLERDIKNLACNFAEGTEYFKLLVDVFAKDFRNPKNMHLRNFFVIVPALTINFVEYLIISKDKMTKKDKQGAAFTDDGFSMGLAYISKLLDQNTELDSLHWFQSVAQKYNHDKSIVEKQRETACKDDLKLQQTLSLTEKRLEIYQQEFNLLYYSFSSARIFFQ